MGETILVCEQRISFSNDFGCSMTAKFDITFIVKDIEEGEKMAEFFQRDNQIVPLRIMKSGYGIVYKEFAERIAPLGLVVPSTVSPHLEN
jgi:hypothetical protein